MIRTHHMFFILSRRTLGEGANFPQAAQLNARRFPSETASWDGSLQQDGDFRPSRRAAQFAHDLLNRWTKSTLPQATCRLPPALPHSFVDKRLTVWFPRRTVLPPQFPFRPISRPCRCPCSLSWKSRAAVPAIPAVRSPIRDF